MKYLISVLLVFSVAASAKDSKPDVFQLCKFEVQKLGNGLKILWLPDSALPYTAFEMMIGAGSSQDPAGKEGLAGFTAGMLEKGTIKRSATQISEDLEQIGSG